MEHLGISDLNEPAVGRDLLERFDAELRRDPPPEAGFRFDRSGGILRAFRPHCWIVWWTFGAAQCGAAVAREAARFRAAGRSVEWKVYGYDGPPNLQAELTRTGFVPDDVETLMALDVRNAAIPPPLALPPSFVVRRVVDERGLTDIVAVTSQAFDGDAGWMLDALVPLTTVQGWNLALDPVQTGDAAAGGNFVRHAGVRDCMKAAVYHAPRDIRVDSVPDPKLHDPGDAIVRVVDAAICGSDLWPYRGIADRQPGTRIGHEFIGVVQEAGKGVTMFAPGDFVAAPFCFSDNVCDYCHAGLYTSCRHGGYWGSGDVDGGQGEFVRVPQADGTLRPIPEAVAHDDAKRASALTLTDVMSTGHHGCVRAGVKAGSTVAVIGDGAVGLCAIISAKRSNAARIFAIGHHAARLELARTFGATDVIDSKDPHAAQKIIDATDGGVTAVVEAVGSQATMDLGVSIVRPGGTLAFVGVPYGVSTFDARKLFSDNISIAGALAPTRAYIDELMADVTHGRIDPGAVLTLRLPLEQAPQGYRAMDDRSTIKVLLEISAV